MQLKSKKTQNIKIQLSTKKLNVHNLQHQKLHKFNTETRKGTTVVCKESEQNHVGRCLNASWNSNIALMV